MTSQSWQIEIWIWGEVGLLQLGSWNLFLQSQFRIEELFPEFKFILGLGTFPHLGEMCFLPWDLQLHFQCLNSTLASFLYHAVQNGTSNLDRQRGWIYLLVYLLVIKGKEMNSQTGIWDFSSTQAHVPFSSLSKQV